MGAPSFRRATDVAFRQVGGELLLVPIRTSPEQEMGVFALNRVAAHVWESLEGALTADDLAGCVTARFEVAPDVARRDVDALLELLASRKLVEKVEG